MNADKKAQEFRKLVNITETTNKANYTAESITLNYAYCENLLNTVRTFHLTLTIGCQTLVWCSLWWCAGVGRTSAETSAAGSLRTRAAHSSWPAARWYRPWPVCPAAGCYCRSRDPPSAPPPPPHSSHGLGCVALKRYVYTADVQWLLGAADTEQKIRNDRGWRGNFVKLDITIAMQLEMNAENILFRQVAS